MMWVPASLHSIVHHNSHLAQLAQKLYHFCGEGKPRKGKPVLAYFDNPPSFNTWNEIGRYCEDVSRHIDQPAVRAWKSDPDSADLSAFPLIDIAQRICGDDPPGAGFCDPIDVNPAPRKMAGLDLRPRLVHKEPDDEF